MEADWEIEIGGSAPVIDALWTGLVDLRRHPERIGEIAESAAFPPLAGLLLALNRAGSWLWTAKCDVWEPDAEEMAGLDGEDIQAPTNPNPKADPESKADLPGGTELDGTVNLDAEDSFRGGAAALACYVDLLPSAGLVFADWHEAEDCCRRLVAELTRASLSFCQIDLIVRKAVAGDAEGFGITLYAGAIGADSDAATRRLAQALAVFQDAVAAAHVPAETA